jgi:hypothetical protein
MWNYNGTYWFPGSCKTDSILLSCFGEVFQLFEGFS